jgi:hypothetical protein
MNFASKTKNYFTYLLYYSINDDFLVIEQNSNLRQTKIVKLV